MILAIDIGNTNIVVGCIDSKQTYFIERLSTVRTKTELEYAVDLKTVLDLYHIKRIDIEGCIISSVVPQITNAVKLAAEKVLKKEKRELLLWKIVGIIVLVALVGWIGFSVYQNVQKDASHTYEMKTDALDHYMNGLNAETETSSEASTETTEKTTEETAAETSAESTVTEAAGETAAE